jgi:two-component sensor histidine kinase
LRLTNLRTVIKSYDRLLAPIAERLEKELAPIEIRAETDIWLDPRRYRHFFATLVHVFRNALVHGIEEPDVRCAAGKDPTGQLICTVRSDGGRLDIEIADDGAGIDTAALRRRAIQLGRVSEAESAKWEDERVLETIFMDGMSTRASADDLAGRGVGLAAVRAAVRQLGGDVAVGSVLGQGTTFRFGMPIHESAAATTLYYPRTTGADDNRDDYPVALLAHLLGRLGKTYHLEPTLDAMEQDAAIFELMKSDGMVDIVWTMTSEAREAALFPIRRCLYKGMGGWRIALVREADQFRAVATLGDLGAFVAGQGHDWPDTDVLRANGLPVEAVAYYGSLFGLLADGTIDYFPRSVLEVLTEAERHATDGIVIDPHLLIRYPAATYFFVNGRNAPLAEELRQAFDDSLADGSFDRLFREHFGDSIDRLKLDDRRVIELS